MFILYKTLFCFRFYYGMQFYLQDKIGFRFDAKVSIKNSISYKKNDFFAYMQDVMLMDKICKHILAIQANLKQHRLYRSCSWSKDDLKIATKISDFPYTTLLTLEMYELEYVKLLMNNDLISMFYNILDGPDLIIYWSLSSNFRFNLDLFAQRRWQAWLGRRFPKHLHIRPFILSYVAAYFAQHSSNFKQIKCLWPCRSGCLLSKHA